jgi:hypothetical protein
MAKGNRNTSRKAPDQDHEPFQLLFVSHGNLPSIVRRVAPRLAVVDREGMARVFREFLALVEGNAAKQQESAAELRVPRRQFDRIAADMLQLVEAVDNP